MKQKTCTGALRPSEYASRWLGGGKMNFDLLESIMLAITDNQIIFKKKIYLNK